MKGLKILVVEDSSLVMRFNKMIIETLGYKADYASSAEEALKLYFSKLYDLIITDIGLPQMSGLEMASKIRWFEHRYCLDRASIFVISSHDLNRLKESILMASIDGAYSKPVTREIMASIIKHVESILENV